MLFKKWLSLFKSCQKDFWLAFFITIFLLLVVFMITRDNITQPFVYSLF